MLAFWDVGICQPPLKSRSTIYFYWSKAAGLKSVSWKWIYLIPSHPDSLISWKSHLPVILKRRVSSIWAYLFSLQALYIAVILVLSAVTNSPWTLLCSVASSPLPASHGCVQHSLLSIVEGDVLVMGFWLNIFSALGLAHIPAVKNRLEELGERTCSCTVWGFCVLVWMEIGALYLPSYKIISSVGVL